MPLSAELEAFLGTIQDATQREAMRKDLNEGYLRQQDYSRKMNDLKSKTDEWTSWHEKANKKFSDMEQDRNRLASRVTELESAKTALEQLGDDGGDPDLNKALASAKADLHTANGKISAMEGTITDFNRRVEAGEIVSKDLFEKKLDEELTRRGDQLGEAMFEVMDKMSDYQATFGKKLDRNLLISEAAKRKGNINEAYEFLTQKDREEHLRKTLEAEYEKKFQERLRTSSLPIDTGSGEPVLGPLQARLRGRKDDSIPDNVKVDGSGKIGAILGAELRAEGHT